MTPIERACRALAELHGRDPDEPVLLTDRRLWQEFEPQVRAVIAAIREPSDAMAGAWLGSGRESVTAERDWQVMIDALLEEGREDALPR